MQHFTISLETVHYDINLCIKKAGRATSQNAKDLSLSLET
jgi:hypothetical protein